MPSRGLIKMSLRRGPTPRFDKIELRMRAPLRGAAGRAVAEVMRKGEGSVKQQFQQTTYLNKSGARRRWKRTEPFGNRPAPARTLHRTGSLQRAWTGEGSGSITRQTDKSVKIGVDTTRFPQAGVFQKITRTLIRPKRMGAGGRSRMHWKLGLTYGVWISDRRLNMGLRIEPRRVGVNPAMLKRAKKAMSRYVLTGRATSAGGRR